MRNEFICPSRFRDLEARPSFDVLVRIQHGAEKRKSLAIVGDATATKDGRGFHICLNYPVMAFDIYLAPRGWW